MLVRDPRELIHSGPSGPVRSDGVLDLLEIVRPGGRESRKLWDCCERERVDHASRCRAELAPDANRPCLRARVLAELEARLCRDGKERGKYRARDAWQLGRSRLALRVRLRE